MSLITAPGLIDMHVHLREPGYEYKEDIMSGAAAAAAGGFSTVCCMPNTLPVADTPEVVKLIADKAAGAPVRVLPIGAVTVGQRGRELTNFAALKMAGAVAVSDDGMPVADDGIMQRAMLLAKETGLLLISHCEPETEMAARDIRIAAETGARIHIAHVSAAETVEVVRQAKASGVQVTAETCPHYFSLTSEEIARQGANACMNPPLRNRRDVEAVIEGLCDGTIDVIVTDHAPHSVAEKSLPVGQAPNGIIGLETSLAVTLTYLYHTGIFTIDEIIEKMSVNPARILQLDGNSGMSPISAIYFDPDEEWVVDPLQFKSKSRNTPYAGMTLRGKVKRTVCNGHTVYEA